ncbi:hypothetical protein KR044_012211 [Drosophila immigrans]|nr:hypothetical protein KR044_012211 [Drosophila immigrans]
MNWVCNIKFAIFCLIISIWGTIQLVVMGVCLSMNALAFVHSLPLDDSFDSLEEFRIESDRVYKEAALRFYVTAALYGVFAVMSLICIRLKKNQNIKLRNEAIRRSHQV